MGVHGPDRQFAWLGPLGVAYDWTAGCIVLATNDEIDAVARFVRRARPEAIHIR